MDGRTAGAEGLWAGVHRGQLVAWDGGGRFRVVGRREVDGLAMIQTGTHEVYLSDPAGGGDPGWVPENEVEPVEEADQGVAR